MPTKSAYRLVSVSDPTIAFLESVISYIKQAFTYQTRIETTKRASYFVCEYIDSRAFDFPTNITESRLENLTPLHGGIYEALCFVDSHISINIILYLGEIFVQSDHALFEGTFSAMQNWVKCSPKEVDWSIPITISLSPKEILPSFDGILAYLPTKTDRASTYAERMKLTSTIERSTFQSQLERSLPFITASMIARKPTIEVGGEQDVESAELEEDS